MSFMQLIRFRTDDPTALQELSDRWVAETGSERTATRLVLCRVRGEDDAYVQLVEFPSADAAQANSGLEATDRWAEDMRKLSHDGMEFTDLDVVRTVEL